MPKYNLLKIMNMFLDCNDFRTAVHACLERKKPLWFIYFYTEWGIELKRSQTNISILGCVCICFTVAFLRFLCDFAPFLFIMLHLILYSNHWNHISALIYFVSLVSASILLALPQFGFTNRFTSSSIFLTFCLLEIKINFTQTCAGGSTEPKRARELYHLIFCWHH